MSGFATWLDVHAFCFLRTSSNSRTCSNHPPKALGVWSAAAQKRFIDPSQPSYHHSVVERALSG